MKRAAVIFPFVLFLSACGIMQPAIFKQEYSEQFQALNTGFWEPASHTFDNNLAYFNPENIALENGNLILRLKHENIFEKKISGAELRSIKNFKYGKFTVSMKAASGPGIVSAFFLYSTKSKTNKEIDIEITGKNTSVVHFNHWTSLTDNGKEIELGFDASKDFHQYAIIWLPNQIIWEVDGKEVYRVSHSVPQAPMKLMLNLWASKPNTWAGVFNAAELPKETLIDYVEIIPYKSLNIPE